MASASPSWSPRTSPDLARVGVHVCCWTLFFLWLSLCETHTIVGQLGSRYPGEPDPMAWDDARLSDQEFLADSKLVSRHVRNCLGGLRHQDAGKILQEMAVSLVSLAARIDKTAEHHRRDLVVFGALTGHTSVLLLECHLADVQPGSEDVQVVFAAVGLWQLEDCQDDQERLAREFLGVRGTCVVVGARAPLIMICVQRAP